jgi:hypothetical protein
MKTIKRSLIVLFLVLVIALLTSGVVAAYEPIYTPIFDVLPGIGDPFGPFTV